MAFSGSSILSILRRPFSGPIQRYYDSTRQSFYEARNILSGMKGFEQFITSRSTHHVKSYKPINFYGLAFSSSRKQAVKHLGKPNYQLKTQFGIKKHEVLFYKITIHQVKCILQLHFHDQLFFMAAIELRSQKTDFNRRVIDLIRRKYDIDEAHWNGKVIDGSGHTIETRNNINPYVVYRTGDQDVLDNIQFHVDNLAYHRQRKEENELEFLLDIF